MPESSENRLSPKLTRQLFAIMTVLFGLATLLMLAAFLVSDGSPPDTYVSLVMSLIFLAATCASGRAFLTRRGNKP